LPIAFTGLLLAAFFELLTESVARAGPGNAIVLASTVPFFVALLARIFLREKVSLSTLIGLVAGFAGVTMVVSSQLGGDEGGTELALGMFFALLAALSGGGSTIVLKEVAEKHPDLDAVGFTTGQLLVGGAVVLALALGVDGTGGADWSSGELWGAVAFISIGATAIASVAFLGGLKRLSATRASAWLFLSPVVAVIIEIALGETPAALVFAGMVLTIAGIAIVNAPPRFLARL
jgi:drug/metabolite transporter (DMT)-like permease